MIACDIYFRTRQKIPKSLFQGLLPRAAKILLAQKKISSSKKYFLELTLVGTQTMIRLNNKYRRKNKPTDVISLCYFSSGMSDAFAGEIFICLPYASGQAKKIGQSLSEELRFLFIHGLLHCFGYDHKKPREEKQMRRLTYGILGRRNGG